MTIAMVARRSLITTSMSCLLVPRPTLSRRALLARFSSTPIASNIGDGLHSDEHCQISYWLMWMVSGSFNGLNAMSLQTTYFEPHKHCLEKQ